MGLKFITLCLAATLLFTDSSPEIDDNVEIETTIENYEENEPSAYPIAYSDNQLEYFNNNYPSTRDQSPYGTCYAYSAIAAEEFYAITHGLENKTVDYSEAQFIYWNFNTLPIGQSIKKDEIINGNMEMNSGAIFSDVINTLSHGVGPVYESEIPQSMMPNFINGEKLSDDTAIKYDFLLENAYQITDKKDIKNHIIENGAINVEMLYSAQYSNPNKKDAYYCTNDAAYQNTNHMLVIVGQDDNYPKENFTARQNPFEQTQYGGTPNNNGAQLARNSSSSTVEESSQSYFQISYETTQLYFYKLDFTTDLTYNKEYTYNQTGQLTTNSKTASIYVNYFTIENDCELGKVSFLMSRFNKQSNYTLDIYKVNNNFNINNLLNMTPLQSISGITKGGLEYCKISINPISLKTGDNIVISIKFPEANSHIVTESDTSSFQGYKIDYHASPKQSYIYRNGQIDIGDTSDVNNIISLQTTKGYTGLRYENGELYYYKDGIIDYNEYGFILYENSYFLVAHGKVAKINGLIQDPNNKDNQYYCSNGRICDYTGLVQYNNAQFYVTKGKLDTTINGFIEYNNNYFYVAAGRLLQEANGLVQDPNSNEQYFVSNGQVQVQYTGLTLYDNTQFYIQNGRFAQEYIGYVDYDGSTFYIYNGILIY